MEISTVENSILPRLAVWGTTSQLLHRNVLRFQGGLVFKAHRLLYHSTLGLRVIKQKKKKKDHFTFEWARKGLGQTQ